MSSVMQLFKLGNIFLSHHMILWLVSSFSKEILYGRHCQASYWWAIFGSLESPEVEFWTRAEAAAYIKSKSGWPSVTFYWLVVTEFAELWFNASSHYPSPPPCSRNWLTNWLNWKGIWILSSLINLVKMMAFKWVKELFLEDMGPRGMEIITSTCYLLHILFILVWHADMRTFLFDC